MALTTLPCATALASDMSLCSSIYYGYLYQVNSFEAPANTQESEILVFIHFTWHICNCAFYV
jgi:hypothetical protein